MNKSTITVHMVSSLDGFIAKKDNSVDWLHSDGQYPQGITLTDDDIMEFLQSIDCYVMGSKTYEHALKLGWPYGDTPVTVLTQRDLTTDRKNVRFYSGDLMELVNQLKSSHRSIWMVGGAFVTREFLRLGLADEILVSIMPVILGEGTPFFDQIQKEFRLDLQDVKGYKDGMVEMRYQVRK